MSEEGEEPKSIQRAAVPLTPQLYKELVEPSLPHTKQSLLERFWGLLDKVLTQSYISEREYRQLIYKVKYLLLLDLMSRPPTEIDFSDLIDKEQVELVVRLQLRRSVNGIEKALFVVKPPERPKPRRKSLLEALLGGGE